MRFARPPHPNVPPRQRPVSIPLAVLDPNLSLRELVAMMYDAGTRMEFVFTKKKARRRAKR